MRKENLHLELTDYWHSIIPNQFNRTQQIKFIRLLINDISKVQTKDKRLLSKPDITVAKELFERHLLSPNYKSKNYIEAGNYKVIRSAIKRDIALRSKILTAYHLALTKLKDKPDHCKIRQRTVDTYLLKCMSTKWLYDFQTPGVSSLTDKTASSNLEVVGSTPI